MLLPWVVVIVVVLRTPSAPPPAATAGEALNPDTGYYDEFVRPGRPGPWGELQYSRILIEPPDEFIGATALQPDQLRWVFKGYSRGMLSALWQAAHLSAAEIAELEAPEALETTSEAILIKPHNPLVLGLSNQARKTIYTALSVFVENPDQNEPFRFRADRLDEWFANSEVPPDIIALVRKMIYTRGNSALFSDHDVVLPMLPTRAAKLALITTLARKSTLLLKLRVTPKSNLDEITRYWGRGPRAKDIGPLLASVSKRPRGITVDVAHLLPRFARARLFTYPQPVDHPNDVNHDCHWTSLNFFNDPPDERFADAEFVRRTLEQDYNPVEGKPAFGDIFVFTRPDGSVVHSCVYVADDIVFTKNGSSFAMPWMLMSLNDVIAFYPADSSLTVRAFRRKDL